MIEDPRIFLKPENTEDCNNLSCDKCSIMYDTKYGDTLPTCLYFEKSMRFLEMGA